MYLVVKLFLILINIFLSYTYYNNRYNYFKHLKLIKNYEKSSNFKLYYKNFNTNVNIDNSFNKALTCSWTETEDSYIIESRINDLKWKDISIHLNRSISACFNRYSSIINKKYKYSNQLSILLSAVVTYGENWKKISEVLNINKDFCRLQYINYLKTFKNEPWSSKEDELLLTLFYDNAINISNTLEDVNIKDFFQTSPSASFHLYANNTQIPWRNISHILNRSSYDCRKRFLQISFNRTLIPDVWLDGEIQRLLELTQERGLHWCEIGRELGRSDIQCYHTYNNMIIISNNSVNKSNVTNEDNSFSSSKVIRSRLWNKDEDAQLLQFYQQYNNQWKLIGKHLNRSSSQCFQRYHILINTINNNSTRRGWTIEENKQLYQLVNEYGAQWTLIGKKLNRTSYVCRAAYKRLVDKSPPNTLVMPSHHTQVISSHKDNNVVNDLLIEDDIYNNTIIYNHTILNLLDNLKSISMNRSDYKKQWTKEEDEYVSMLVKYVGRKWSMIAEAIGRSPEDVMLRYDFKISPKKTGSWTKYEDDKLIELVNQIGPRWTQIGDILGRTGTQCASKYRQTLDPRLKWRLWTNDEDEQLIILRNEAKYNWGMISAVLDRAGPSCRYRYLKLKKNNQYKNYFISNSSTE